MRVSVKGSLLGLVLVAATAAVLVAPSSRSADRLSGLVPPSVFPGGRYFTVLCGFSHRNNDDPIRYPGSPGLSHSHSYVGNRSVDAFSTSASLRGGSTTCDFPQDASGYWAPTLYAGLRPIQPMAALAYYVKRTTADVVPYPTDLEVVAGNANARKAQPRGVVSWGCDGFGGIKRYALIPTCAGRGTLDLRVQFPDCWNGKTGDSPDHQSHMAYATGGKCPAAHPVAVPTLLLILLYPPVLGRAQLASGRFGGHADFMNGWDKDTFSKFVAGLNY